MYKKGSEGVRGDIIYFQSFLVDKLQNINFLFCQEVYKKHAFLVWYNVERHLIAIHLSKHSCSFSDTASSSNFHYFAKLSDIRWLPFSSFFNIPCYNLLNILTRILTLNNSRALEKNSCNRIVYTCINWLDKEDK